MDFLDPRKERRNTFTLYAGYVLVTIAVCVGALWLLVMANGWTRDKQGQVVQNGLVFVSSQPSGAHIYLNGQQYSSDTNSRVIVNAGDYLLQIAKEGYRTWQRRIVVVGGDVQHFDYPFMWPQKLKTTSVTDLDTDPSVASQSLDRRWLLLDKPGVSGTFVLYDLKDPKKVVTTDLTLPAAAITPGAGAQSWQVEEWAADNKHVLLLHTYVNSTGATAREYIVLDRTAPDQAQNLTTNLQLAENASVSLYNNRTDQVWAYSPDDLLLQRLDASDGTVKAAIQHVLAYKTYGTDKLLYVTDTANTILPTGQVSVLLQVGGQTTTLRMLPAAGSGTYVLNMADYSGDWYVTVAATNDKTVYVYKNPQSFTATKASPYPALWHRLALANPSYVSFSANTQFLVAESAQNFVVYDLENKVAYDYTTSQPLDAPQQHASWMDGDRLMYVSGGELTVFDYDDKNQQTLVPANAGFLPAFAPDYEYLYTLRPDAGDGSAKPGLDSTALTVVQ